MARRWRVSLEDNMFFTFNKRQMSRKEDGRRSMTRSGELQTIATLLAGVRRGGDLSELIGGADRTGNGS